MIDWNTAQPVFLSELYSEPKNPEAFLVFSIVVEYSLLVRSNNNLFNILKITESYKVGKKKLTHSVKTVIVTLRNYLISTVFRILQFTGLFL